MILSAPVFLSPAASGQVVPSLDRPAVGLDPTDLELQVAIALEAVVHHARGKGHTLAQVQAAVLADHQLLDAGSRQRLSDVLAEAWDRWPTVA